MNSSAVIGLGFGDEGKGLMTSYLCSKEPKPLVIRYSGGQQAGHTVYYDNDKHVFSNFGSGSLQQIPTYWSKHCTVDPIGIINELTALGSKGYTPLLLIDYKCPVTTPYDSHYNRADAFDDGTVGVGVGSTFEREENFYSLLFEDLFFPSILKIKLERIRNYYGFELDLTRFLECVEDLKLSYCVMGCNGVPKEYLNYIFEGSQGLLLDQNIGFFPHVTRSNVDLTNPLQIVDKVNSIYLVTRAYQTRHGNGPMTNEDIPHNIKSNPEETNVTNEFQGELRVSLLDLDLIKYAMVKADLINKNPSLVITCLDHIENEWRYTLGGTVYSCIDEKEFIDTVAIHLGFTSIYISKTPYSKNIVKYR